MKVIICLDQNMGFSFNGKRQSKDKYVIEDIMQYIEYKKSNIYVKPYSFDLFKDYDVNAIPDSNSYCFLEGNDVYNIPNLYDKIDELIVYCWNTVYPSDSKLCLNFLKFSSIETNSFEGFSHEKITRFVLKK